MDLNYEHFNISIQKDINTLDYERQERVDGQAACNVRSKWFVGEEEANDKRT